MIWSYQHYRMAPGYSLVALLRRTLCNMCQRDSARVADTKQERLRVRLERRFGRWRLKQEGGASRVAPRSRPL
jgi:hypothetical protein